MFQVKFFIKVHAFPIVLMVITKMLMMLAKLAIQPVLPAVALDPRVA
jgi:hypothetical protein